jgi:hypothetical protein
LHILFGNAAIRFFSIAERLHIPRGWAIVSLAILAWIVVILVGMGVAALF